MEVKFSENVIGDTGSTLDCFVKLDVVVVASVSMDEEKLTFLSVLAPVMSLTSLRFVVFSISMEFFIASLFADLRMMLVMIAVN